MGLLELLIISVSAVKEHSVEGRQHLFDSRNNSVPIECSPFWTPERVETLLANRT